MSCFLPGNFTLLPNLRKAFELLGSISWHFAMTPRLLSEAGATPHYEKRVAALDLSLGGRMGMAWEGFQNDGALLGVQLTGPPNVPPIRALLVLIWWHLRSKLFAGSWVVLVVLDDCGPVLCFVSSLKNCWKEPLKGAKGSTRVGACRWA